MTVDVIRAWERRYGLLQPTRSEGNFRLYGPQDVARLRLMRHYVHQNIAPSRAAVLVAQAKARLDSNPGIPPGDVRKALTVLHEALERFDDGPAEKLLQRLVSVFTPGAVLRDVILPYLRELGERWERDGDGAALAQQHFATCLLEGWMLGVVRGHVASGERTAVLACVPGEQHALGLAAFAVALADHDWSIVYLGRDAPLEAVQAAADTVGADAIVLAATLPDALAEAADAIGELAQRHAVMLGGRAAPHVAPALVSAHALAPEILVAARLLAESAPRRTEELALR